jgi:hypothetical protein
MIAANKANQAIIRVQNSEISNFPVGTFDNVRACLSRLEYKIADIEESTGNISGWSISWDSSNQNDTPYLESNVTKDAVTFFESQPTRINFPSKAGLRAIFKEHNINNILETIRQKIIEANNSNQTSVKIINASLECVSDVTITSVKDFLIEQGYTIIEIEDLNGAIIGWRLSWK